MKSTVDVLIIGAGAAGLMCAIEAGKRGRSVVILDHANKVGKKILMSGGGRCNFTNLYIHPSRYISHNSHFCKSALSRYTQWDFIKLVEQHGIPYHEKTQGQLFCDNKAKDIVSLLLKECEQQKVDILLNTKITALKRLDDYHFTIRSTNKLSAEVEFHKRSDVADFSCRSLVVATGGLSIPTLGASPFGYKIAEQFGLNLWPTRAGLVPLTLQNQDKERWSELSGISVNSEVTVRDQTFSENILFTHRGLSGPAILQISSYWHPGETVIINLLPNINLFEFLKTSQQKSPQLLLKSLLADYLPKRVIRAFLSEEFSQQTLQSISHNQFRAIADQLQCWRVKPHGTEGYRTAEVTLGGVDCNSLSSKTMEAMHVPGLYFIGEVIDVTGWLGGYNFQWAWSSGWAAGQVV